MEVEARAVLESTNTIIGIIVGLIAIGSAIAAAIVRWRRRTPKEVASPVPEPDPEGEPPGPPPQTSPEPEPPSDSMGFGAMVADQAIVTEKAARTVLVARDVMLAVDFKDREPELTRIGELVDQGRGVIWVTGPAWSGKSWFASRFVRDRGWEGKAARFELRGGADVQAVLEGMNRFLRDRDEDRFDSWCKTGNVAIADKASALCNVLKGGGYVVVLDSFEDVADEGGWADLIAVMQEALDGSCVFLGSRRMPDWGDPHCQVEIGAIEEDAGKELLAEAGVPESALDELFHAVGGLPGALESVSALVKKRTLREVLENIGRYTGEIAENLLADTYEAATDDARRLWTGLCVLPGPVTRDEARAVCEDLAFDDAWDELVRWQLLKPGEERAELHPLARAVGERRLDEMAEWRQTCGQRIAKHYAQLAEEKAEDRTAIEVELENLLAAARLASEYREWEALWGMGDALNQPLEYAGRWTAREELLRLCADGAAKARNKQERATFTHNLGIALQQRGNLEEAEDLYRQSLAIAREVGDRPGEAISLHQLGMVAEIRGNLEDAEGLYKQARDVFVEIGDRMSEASVLHQLGMVAEIRCNLEEAEDLYRQSLAIAREVGDRPGEAISLHQLGMVAEIRGNLEDAEGLYKQARDVFVEIGDRMSEASVLHQLGMVAEIRCNLEDAEDLYRQSLEIEREMGHRHGVAVSLHQLGMLAEAQGNLPLAVERMQEAHRMFAEMGLAEADKAKQELDRLRTRLAEEGGAGQKG